MYVVAMVDSIMMEFHTTLASIRGGALWEKARPLPVTVPPDPVL